MEEREVYKNLAEKTGDSLEAIYRLPNAEREELLEVFQLSVAAHETKSSNRKSKLAEYDFDLSPPQKTDKKPRLKYFNESDDSDFEAESFEKLSYTIKNRNVPVSLGKSPKTIGQRMTRARTRILNSDQISEKIFSEDSNYQNDVRSKEIERSLTNLNALVSGGSNRKFFGKTLSDFEKEVGLPIFLPFPPGRECKVDGSVVENFYDHLETVKAVLDLGMFGGIIGEKMKWTPLNLSSMKIQSSRNMNETGSEDENFTPVEEKNIDEPAMGAGEEIGSKFKLTSEKDCRQNTSKNITKRKKAKKLNNIVQTGVVKPFTPDVATVEQTKLTKDDEEISIVAELKSPFSTPRISDAKLHKRASASNGSN